MGVVTKIIAVVGVALAPLAVQADASAGQKVFKKCRSCHEVGANAKVKLGPPLNNIVGRVAGSYEGAKYSTDMIKAGQDGLIWTVENLDRYLSKPRALIKRTSMSFSGLKKEKDRAALITFLKTQTGQSGAGMIETDPQVAPEVLAISGDLEYGEYLSSTCVTCHQASGEDKGIPSIIGWPQKDFVTVMHAYKNKFRENQVMQQQAGALNNEEIAALAAYFEQAE